jgi:hypothetical protein
VSKPSEMQNGINNILRECIWFICPRAVPRAV